MTEKPPIWTEPLELVCDGTPVVFDDPDNPADSWGDYHLVRDDGLPFTDEQHPEGREVDIIVTTEGKHWEHCGPDDPVLVRNRVQMDAVSEADDTDIAAVHSYLASVGYEPEERDPEGRILLEAFAAHRLAAIAAMMAERDKGGVT